MTKDHISSANNHNALLQMENAELEDEASWLEKEMADLDLVNDRHVDYFPV